MLWPAAAFSLVLWPAAAFCAGGHHRDAHSAVRAHHSVQAAEELDFWGQPFEPAAEPLPPPAAAASSIGRPAVSGGSRVTAAAAVAEGVGGGGRAVAAARRQVGQAAVRDDGQCLSMHQPW